MKPYIASICAAIALSCAFFVAPVTMTGCKTADLRTVQVAQGTHIGVKQAMALWRAKVIAKEVTVEQERQVKRLYNKYRASQIAVAELIKADIVIREAGGDESANQEKRDAAIKAASEAIDGILNVLKEFKVIP